MDAGLVDNLDKSVAAADLFVKESVDMIFLYISTYALSSTVLPVVQKAKVPVVVLNLQPVSHIDYETFNNLPSREEKTGEWLAHCQACSVPEVASVFNRAGIDYHLVTGTLDDPEAWSEMRNWVDAAYGGQSVSPGQNWADGTLLWRHARCLFRLHPAYQCFWQPL